MSNPMLQQDLAILSAAKSGLLYLTANDWTLIADKATRMHFRAGEHITREGKRTHGIFILLSGSASVHIPGREILPALQPGQVCGEISFLDEQPASVSVVAKQALDVYYLDRATLQSLFELFPHLGSRFYHSLALNLSSRVRDMIGSMSTPKK
ncbi:MAG TPA: cyclic nucleotide-binding domain-containing protein [Verrucomicrobiae bacterium]|jgi:CRP-like cAMP-binding protein|nr:cyclic nucleotide-binding domain-containing protein [Verrucomicrobiae bacterium]